MNSSIIARQSVLVALACLIPVPFLDTWIQGRLRQGMVRELGQHSGIELDPPTVRALAHLPSSLVLGCVLGTIWWPIKKLFRKIVYILTLKDAVDAVSDTWLRGAMIRQALDAGFIPADTDRVCRAMQASLAAHTRSPLWGPKTHHGGPVCPDTAPPMVRAVARIAQRGGGAAALAHFSDLLANPAPPGAAPVSPRTQPLP